MKSKSLLILILTIYSSTLLFSNGLNKKVQFEDFKKYFVEIPKELNIRELLRTKENKYEELPEELILMFIYDSKYVERYFYDTLYTMDTNQFMGIDKHKIKIFHLYLLEKNKFICFLYLQTGDFIGYKMFAKTFNKEGDPIDSYILAESTTDRWGGDCSSYKTCFLNKRLEKSTSIQFKVDYQFYNKQHKDKVDPTIIEIVKWSVANNGKFFELGKKVLTSKNFVDEYAVPPTNVMPEDTLRYYIK